MLFRGVFPDTSGNQDMGLLPSDLSHDGHTTLRSCHSTSDCKTPSLLSSSKKFKRSVEVCWSIYNIPCLSLVVSGSMPVHLQHPMYVPICQWQHASPLTTSLVCPYLSVAACQSTYNIPCLSLFVSGSMPVHLQHPLSVPIC